MCAARWTFVARAACSLLLLAGVGCGDRSARLPAGEPLDVVRQSPDRTIAAGRVRVAIALPADADDLRVDLGDEQAARRVLVPLDLLRGAVFADPFGGQAIRGAGALRYDLRIDLSEAEDATPVSRRSAVAALAPADPEQDDVFKAAVWIDVEGRVRRIQLAVDLFADPPLTIPSRHPALVTYDYFEFSRRPPAGRG